MEIEKKLLKKASLDKLFDKLKADGKKMYAPVKKENQINPLIGASGVAAVPDSARIAHEIGLKEDPTNHLISHAMAPNIAGLIGSAVTAGLMLAFLL